MCSKLQPIPWTKTVLPVFSTSRQCPLGLHKLREVILERKGATGHESVSESILNRIDYPPADVFPQKSSGPLSPSASRWSEDNHLGQWGKPNLTSGDHINTNPFHDIWPP